MLSGRDIVLISSIEWSYAWQHPQEIAVRLVRAGNRVLYIENTGVRTPGLKDAARVARRLKHWVTSLRARGVRQVAPNLYVCSPVVLPPFGSRWRRRVNEHLLLRWILRVARQLGLRDIILWTHLPTDTALDIIRLLHTPRGAVVYYCIADFTQLTPSARQLLASEQAIAQMSDVIFANTAQLAAHCAQWNDNVHLFPPGVNIGAFPAEATGAAADSAPELPDAAHSLPGLALLRSLPRPIIGYVGGLHRYVDFDLLAALAQSRQQWSWVFVGPQTAVSDLRELPNVHLLGQQEHTQLIHFIRHFDVCLVPYKNNAETATIAPVKINEYLAAGKPVVSTDLPYVCDFNEQHQVLLTAPGRPQDFLAAIEQALQLPVGPATVTRRREVAMKSDWSTKFAAMISHVEAALRSKGNH
jgi:glycosyltransferase involved in cell wall biosynthesis